MSTGPEGSFGDETAAGKESAPDAGPSFDLRRELAIIEARRRRRKLSDLPKLLISAALLTWRANKPATAVNAAVQLVGAGSVAAVALLGGRAVSWLSQARAGQVSQSLILTLGLLVGAALLAGLSTTGTQQIGRLLGQQVERQITDDILDVATRAELVAFDDPVFYDQLERTLAQLPTRPTAIVTALASLLGGIAGVVTLAITISFVSPFLLPILLVAGVPLWFLERRGAALEFDFAVAQTPGLRERDYLRGLLTDRASAAELRAYDTHKDLRHRYSASYDRFISQARIMYRSRMWMHAFSAIISVVGLLATLLVLVALIDDGSISVGQAAAVGVGVRLLATRVELALNGIGSLYQSALFLHDFSLFAEFTPHVPPTQVTIGRHRPRPTPRCNSVLFDHLPISGRLSLKGVSFAYPNSETPAISDLSFHLRAGEVVAVVGENGSGKSTLAKILAGLYVPQSGTVEWESVASRPLAAQFARSQVTLVLQDFLRYQLSVRDNVTLGRPEIPVEFDRIANAIRSAGAESIIEGLPAGYDSRLSRQFSGGVELSVGQWQRIALARAFYRDSPVVILDEPAAALDPRAEARLYQSVGELLAGRTVVLITHRMQSIRSADRILVMHGGRLVEDGNHISLHASGGLYRELCDLQERSGVSRGNSYPDVNEP